MMQAMRPSHSTFVSDFQHLGAGATARLGAVLAAALSAAACGGAPAEPAHVSLPHLDELPVADRAEAERAPYGCGALTAGDELEAAPGRDLIVVRRGGQALCVDSYDAIAAALADMLKHTGKPRAGHARAASSRGEPRGKAQDAASAAASEAEAAAASPASCDPEPQPSRVARPAGPETNEPTPQPSLPKR